MNLLPSCTRTRALAAGMLAALALAGSLATARAQDAAVGGADGLNCGHFVTIDHAQLFFESVIQRTGIDRYGLDTNADGTACEGGEINTLFDLSCALFVEQADAQALYDLDRGTYRALDADGDGIACSPQSGGGGGGGNRGGTDTGTVITPTDPGTVTTTTTTTTGFDLPAIEIVLPANFPFGTGPSEIGIDISPDELDALDADCLSFAVIGTMVMGHNCAGGDFIGNLPPGTPPDMRISHTPFFQAGAIFTPVGGGGGGRNGGAGQSPAIDPNTGQPIQQQAQATDAATADSGGKRTRTKQKASDAGDAQATAEAAQPARRERKERDRRAREDAVASAQPAGRATKDRREEARAERKARNAERRDERRAARAEARAGTETAQVSAESIQRSVDRAVERAFRER